ncbi:MAG TPA: tetratricopeptide repeat protein [Longimicrobium sp.]|nr:tetratricopeptide repeat protein [Longimicrobium sp.]
MGSPGLSARITRWKHAVRAELAALRADVMRCLWPVVTRYWKGALVALAAAGTVLGMLEPDKWVIKAVAWVAVLGFFVALTVAWAQCRPVAAGGRPAKVRFRLVLAALLLAPVLLLAGISLPRPRVPVAREGYLALLTSLRDPLSSGLADELRNHFIRAGAGLRVLQPRDRESYAARNLSMGEVGRELQAAHVLELVASPPASRRAISVHLWDSRTDDLVWTKRYDRLEDGIFDAQLQIVEQIARELGVRLSREQRARLAVSPTPSEEAYRLYLEGRGLLYPPVRTLEGNADALGRFREALRLDPRFGLAHAGLARGYGVRAQLTRDRVWNDSAIAAARRAVVLAPGEERTHAALGVVLREVGRFDSALVALRSAEALSPKGGDGSGRSNLGLVMMEKGFVQEGVRYGEEAVAIERTSPTAHWRLGMAYEILGNDRNAERAYRAAVALAPNSAEPRFRLARLYWIQDEADRGDPEMSGFGAGPGWCLVFQWDALNGRLQRARDRAAEEGAAAWQCAPVLLALVHLRLGNPGQARVALDTAEAAARDSMEYGHDGSHPRLVLAQVYALRGDVKQANTWFADAVEHGYRHVREARRLPTLEALWKTPEFERTLQEMDGKVLRQRQQVEQRRDSAAAKGP